MMKLVIRNVETKISRYATHWKKWWKGIILTHIR
jgi:hypothetical protein